MVEHEDLRGVADPAEVSGALERHGYLPDRGLATSVFLALRMQRPLFLEGEPGVGKTEVARTLSTAMGTELIRLQCYEGIDATQAVYEWDFSRQILHLRAAEAAASIAGHLHNEPASSARGEELEDSLFTERYLVARPLLRAIRHGGTTPPVLLVDEVDRADDEFEAFLLEALADYSVTVPELGTFTAPVPPVVVLTSNRTRDVHDALKRRCLYHWVEHPDIEREVRIVRARVPEVSEALARQVATVAQRFRDLGLYKPPGVAETIDWATALATLGADALDVDVLTATVGTVLKYREDQDRVLGGDVADMVGEAPGAAGGP